MTKKTQDINKSLNGGHWPPTGDPRWVKWTAPLLQVFQDGRDRTWPQLFQWSDENKVSYHLLRQLVAWLEFYHWIEEVPFSKPLRWRINKSKLRTSASP